MPSGNCAKCGIWRPILHRDHIVPKGLGGPDTDENTQLLCAICDEDKTRDDLRAIARAVPPEVMAAKLAKMRAARKPMSEQTRRRMSAYFSGKPLSPEHVARLKKTWASPALRALVAERNRTRIWTDEQRARMSAGRKGKRHTEAAKVKMSISKRAAGWKPTHTPAQAVAVAAANRRRNSTPEMRAAISAAHSGKVYSPRTRALIALQTRAAMARPEVAAKLRAAWTPERRAAQSARQTGLKRKQFPASPTTVLP